MDIGISSIGVSLGSNWVDPWEVHANANNMKDTAKLRTYLGCEAVPMAKENESTSYFAVDSAQQAMLEGEINQEEVDVIISNNFSSDYLNWQLSAYVAERLGLTNAMPFDVYGGCNTTAVAYHMAVDMMRADDSISTVMLCLAEHLGGGSFPQFIGDGGCTVILQKDQSKLRFVEYANVNEAFDVIGIIQEGGVVNPFSSETSFDGEWEDQVDFNVERYRTELKPVFKQLCARPIQEACDKAGLSVHDLAQVFLIHQQAGFNKGVLECLGLPYEVTPLEYLKNLGHISGFDIFICLKKAIQDGLVKKGDTMAFFTAGMMDFHAFLIKY